MRPRPRPRGPAFRNMADCSFRRSRLLLNSLIAYISNSQPSAKGKKKLRLPYIFCVRVRIDAQMHRAKGAAPYFSFQKIVVDLPPVFGLRRLGTQRLHHNRARSTFHGLWRVRWSIFVTAYCKVHCKVQERKKKGKSEKQLWKDDRFLRRSQRGAKRKKITVMVLKWSIEKHYVAFPHPYLLNADKLLLLTDCFGIHIWGRNGKESVAWHERQCSSNRATSQSERSGAFIGLGERAWRKRVFLVLDVERVPFLKGSMAEDLENYIILHDAT